MLYYRHRKRYEINEAENLTKKVSNKSLRKGDDSNEEASQSVARNICEII